MITIESRNVLDVDPLMGVYMSGVVLDERIRQIPKVVQATKEINKGKLEVMKDLVEMSKQFEMKDLVQAMMANSLLGAGDLAGLGKLLGS
jgi:hypothetical protein